MNRPALLSAAVVGLIFGIILGLTTSATKEKESAAFWRSSSKMWHEGYDDLLIEARQTEAELRSTKKQLSETEQTARILIDKCRCRCAEQKPAEGRPEAQPQPAKNQLVFVGARGCIPCARMRANTLNNPKVMEQIAANYTFIDASGRDGAGRYNVSRFPTYILLAPDGTEIKRGVGYRSPEEFLAWLNQAPKSTPPGESTAAEDLDEKVIEGAPRPGPHPGPRPNGPAHNGFHREGPPHNLGRCYLGREYRHWCFDTACVFECRGWCASLGLWLYWHPGQLCWYRLYLNDGIYVPCDDLTERNSVLIEIEIKK